MKDDLFNTLKQEILEIKDRNPHLMDDAAFVVWFLRAFITEDEKQAVESLTGKAGDKSSDAVYIDHDNRIVFIIQGKYHTNSNISENRSHVIALAALGRSIVTERSESFQALLSKANSIAKESFTEARNYVLKRGYELVLRYVSTGKISDTHIKDSEANIDDFDNVRFEPHDYTDLMKLMQDYIEGASPPIPTINLSISGNEVFSKPDRETGISSFIFSMSGTEIGKLYNDKGIRLFARNIRGFLGAATKVNRVMKATIEEEPEHFWYYNNGITIVCDEAKQIKKGISNIIKVRNAQIINGQQTTRALANAGKNDAEVLVKLIEIPRTNETNSQKYTHLVSEIVSATNWQNAISQSDLKSNDAEQVRIEREFKKLNYFYVRKRMDKKETVKYGSNKYAFKISKEDLARALAACNSDPYEVRLGKDRLFEDDIYSKIFNGRKAAEYITIYWLYTYVNYWSKQTDARRVYAKWHVLNLTWELLQKDLKKIAYRDQFRKIIERERNYTTVLRPLNLLINDLFVLSIKFYNKNKKSEDKVQEARDFYKHVNLHKTFHNFYKQSLKENKKIQLLNEAFINNLSKQIDAPY